VKSDEGRYQCQVVADLINVITADVDLKVKVPPVMNNETEPLVMAEVGKVAELTCEADGFPSPKIIWKKQDGTLLPNGDESYTNGKMVVSKVKREDRGIYVCTAENGVGANQDRVITFQVGFSPNIEVPKPRVPQAPYYEVHLVCLIQAYPPPAIQWIKNDEHLKNGANHLITHFASADDLTTSTLKIYSVSEDDYGKYSCDAANRYGSAVQHMEVYKSTMPICPPLCGDTDLNAGAAKGHSISLILAIATTILCLNL
jgi:neuronal growth regulator 1